MSQEEYRNSPRHSQRRGGEHLAPSSRSRRSADGGESSAPHSSAPRSRRRRRRRMGPLGALIYVVLVIGAAALLAGLGWTWAGDILALNKEPLTATITLPDDIFTTEEVEVEQTDEEGNVTGTTTETVEVADVDYVADLLKESGLIEYKTIFKIFAFFTDAKHDLSPGTFELNTDMDYRALISSMGRGSSNRKTTSVTLTEGMTVAQIFQKLDEAGVSTLEKLNDTAANYDFNFSFLQDVVPLGDPTRLEGYLFPDTYEFYLGEDPVNVLNKMILRFDEMFTDELRALAQENGYSVRDIVIIASMIEKETDGTDQARIASVIYNRLNHPDYETVGLLQIDATIAYVTGRTVTTDDYQNVDSPYNTYLHQGLPPGPISNPGMVALRAALYPADENYYYYALGDDGVHHFFRTKAELDNFLAS